MRGIDGPGEDGPVGFASEIESAHRFTLALQGAGVSAGAGPGGIEAPARGSGARRRGVREMEVELWDSEAGRVRLLARVEGDRVWLRTHGGNRGRVPLERYRARLEAALAEGGMRVVSFLPGPANGR